MYFSKRVITIITYIFLVQFALCDEVLFEKRFDGVQTVSYNSGDRGHYRITNIFLQKISQAGGKLRVFTLYDINYGIEVYCYRTCGGITRLNIYLSDITLEGDINYRDFFIEEQLFPSDMELGLKLSVNGGRYHFKVSSKIPADIQGNRLLHSQQLEIPVSEDAVLDLEVADILFYYDKPALERFKTYTDALHSYYGSVEKLDMVFQQLSLLDPEQPDRVILDEFRLCEAEKTFWDVYHAPFIEVLDLDQFDPAGFKERFNLTKDSVLYYRKRFNNSFSRLYELYYSRGVKEIAGNKRQAALESFQQAVVYNPAHIKSHLYIANIHLKEGKTDSAVDVIEKVLNELYPAGALMDSTVYYIERIFDSYFHLIDSLNKAGRHTEALKIVEKACRFDNKIPVLDYSAGLKERFTDAHTGVYESFLEVIGRALTVISHSYALTYIEHAIDYQSRHSGFIRDGDRVYDYLRQLVDRLLLSGREKYVYKDFTGAESIFGDLMQICEKYPAMDCAEDVAGYLALSSDARRQADLITVEVTIKDPLPDLKTGDVIELLKEEILEKLSHGHLKAWAGETTEANRIMQEMIKKSALYGLIRDPLIKERLITLYKRIGEKECELANRDIKKLLEQYDDLAGAQDFIEANNTLARAEKIIEKNHDCGFCTDKISGKRNMILPAVIYLEKMGKLENLVYYKTQGDYELFVSSYKSVDNYYNDNNIVSFDLDHKTLFEFIISSSDHSFILHCAGYYSDGGYPGKALELLYRVKELGVDRALTSDVQRHAGEMAAHYYAALSPESSPREIIRNLTDNDRWMRYYNRAFMNNWKP